MRRTLLALTLFALLAIAPSAQAASTFGQVFTPTAQTTATVAQTGISSGVGYTVTKDGVITSWSFQADTDGATVRLKAARLNPDGTYGIVGESDYQTVASNQLQSFQTRIPVKAGDVIGTTAQSGKTVAYTGANDDQVVLSPGDQPAGSSGNYSNVQGIRVDVSASVETDGQSTVKLVARSERVGQGSVAATVSAATADPGLANNAAGTNVAIVWKAGRCANVFQAGAGNDVKRGTAAGDLIDGLLGKDNLDGLDGADCLSGGEGDDRLTGDDGNDHPDGRPGDDTLSGGAGHHPGGGGWGAETLARGAANDVA